MTVDEECIHGLTPITCSICLHGIPKREVVKVMSRPFTALYDGQCPVCDLPITPGQRIVFLSTNAHAHVECAP